MRIQLVDRNPHGLGNDGPFRIDGRHLDQLAASTEGLARTGGGGGGVITGDADLRHDCAAVTAIRDSTSLIPVCRINSSRRLAIHCSTASDPAEDSSNAMDHVQAAAGELRPAASGVGLVASRFHDANTPSTA